MANVTVRMETSAVKALTGVKFSLALDLLTNAQPGVVYVCVGKQHLTTPVGVVGCTLKFVSKDMDPATGVPDEGGYEDEYQLEDLPLEISDYMQGATVLNFAEKWDQLGEENEVTETYALATLPSLSSAVKKLIEFLGMQPADRSDKVPPKKNKHILYLAGSWMGGVPVMVRARMKCADDQPGVPVELTVRSTSEDVSMLLAGALA